MLLIGRTYSDATARIIRNFSPIFHDFDFSAENYNRMVRAVLYFCPVGDGERVENFEKIKGKLLLPLRL
jgi:hypothetical protein